MSAEAIVTLKAHAAQLLYRKRREGLKAIQLCHHLGRRPPCLRQPASVPALDGRRRMVAAAKHLGTVTTTVRNGLH